jgi:tRNA dimethylallyltransferase
MHVEANLIVVLGPTATGKTRFAAELASHIAGEIISADSRQVYRYMNLGTGKDYTDYEIDGKLIPFHLIDILEPGNKYNVFEYQKDFLTAYNAIRKRQHIPILCGGTGLYIEAVTKTYRLLNVPKNEELRRELEGKSLQELENILKSYRKLHNTTDTDTTERAIRAIEIEEFYSRNCNSLYNFPEIKPVWFGIRCDPFLRRHLITERLHRRLNEGMVREVRELISRGIKPQDLIYYGLEYKFITRYLLGELSYEGMVGGLNTAIHQFAKRQMTWFRKMERDGIKIHWIDMNLPMNEKLKIAEDLLSVIKI